MVFVTKIVLTYCDKNCSGDRENLLKFKAEIQGENFEITRTIYSKSERSLKFLVTECFLTSSWRFFLSNLEKNHETQVPIVKN